MERSNNSRACGFNVNLDRVAVGGLVLGLAMYAIPFWREGRLRWAFWMTLTATVLHAYTSHRRTL